jgi:hypothetical protein
MNKSDEENGEFIEGDFEGEPLVLGENIKDLSWKSWEPSISELCTKKREGELQLQPSWQRDFVWDQKKASKLIESVLINVPLPIVYLDENKEGIYTVIDGQQRLTSLISFIEGKFQKEENEVIDFTLKGLDILELNGKTFSSLDKTLQRKIKNTPIRCIVIEPKSHPDIKFEIFERLNTGAVKLNDDELRNSVFRGSYINLLKELSENQTFQELLNRPQFKKRMIDRGMILRFLSFWNRTYLKYKPPIKQFVNHEITENRELKEEKKSEYRKVFSHSVDMTSLVFGDKAFRRYIPGNENNRTGSWAATRINMALFDIVMWGFANYEKSQIVPHADAIREELIHLMSSNQEFIDSIMIQTSSTEQVQKRFEIWKESLKNIIGYPGKREPRNFSFSLKKELFELNNACEICKQAIQNIDDAEVDHIEHYWKGGKTIPENARLVHRYCNRQRGGRE